MLKQTYPASVNPKTVRIFGKHLKHNVKGKTVVHTNEDVTVFDAAYSKNNVQKVPTIVLQLFPNLEIMYLQRMKLSYLIRGSFVSCKKLKSIYFADDVIQTVEAGVFKNCSNLSSLNFTNNIIRHLDKDAFNGLSKLKNLTLTKNGLKSLNATQFKDLKGLLELSITFQLFQTLPANIFANLTRLQILNLNNNRLASIPSEFFKSKHYLKAVNLNGNEIASVDSKILTVWPSRATLKFIANSCFNGNIGIIDKKTKLLVESKLSKCFANYNQKTSPAPKLSSTTKKNAANSTKATTTTKKSKTTLKPTTMKNSTKPKKTDHTAKKSIKHHQLFKNDTQRHDVDAPKKKDDWLSSIKKHIFGAKNSTTNATTTKKPKTSSSDQKVVTPINNTKREQAIARFYVNAKNEYCGVIKDATKFIKSVSVKHLTGFSNKNVTVIHFIQSKLINIPAIIMKTFPNVLKISATDCGIQVIDSDLLEECGKLKHLDLSKNKIRFLSGNSLQLCPALESIDLSKNHIETIESNIFQCNPKLQIKIDKLKIIPSRK